ncbi:MAG: endonuclease/exonuclease/phosphatase family protein [Deltaproteobacteria bacterium]|nr:endonuclease/exonuclease/phosphatase family protein [Nannocystaceae bacterium]
MSLVFWNCAVAPTRGRGRRSPEDAAAVIDSAFRSGSSIVALCEVDESAMRAMATRVSGPLGTVTMAEQVGRSRWDLGVFYRADRLTCRSHGATIVRDGGTVVRGARSLWVRTTGGSEFLLYLLHWRSRLRGEQRHRLESAVAVRRNIESDLSNGYPVVVMGDFNDEPFDASLTVLRASRDPRRVLLSPAQWLYNPSWHLAAPRAATPWEDFGTLVRRSGSSSSRYLFDQALTSAHFLDEERGQAPEVRTFREARPSLEPAGSAIVDHLPIELLLP